MLTKLEKAEKRWGGSNTLVDQWLNNRRKLLIQYFTLAGLAPYTRAEKSLPSTDEIKQFCAQLVDYVSEGHFEVYDTVMSECEKNNADSNNTAQLLLPQISKSTHLALDFNDKYSEMADEKTLFQLDGDLSALAHTMESRFELEDQLLEILHKRHSLKA